MNVDIINYKLFENRTEFKITNIKRNWDILIFVIDGEYEVTFKSDQKKMVISKNEIALIPAGEEFDRRVKSTLTYFYITYYPELNHPFYLSAKRGKFKLPSEQTDAIFKTLNRAHALYDNTEIIKHLLCHVFAENYLFGKFEKVKFKPFSEEIENAIRYMRNNLDKKIDIDDLAKRVFLSHTGLIWKFKQELNTTPTNYLTKLRLSHAKQLLLNNFYSITEIAEMCGYSNPFYFTNAFRRYSGMSPTKFRKRYLKDNVNV